MKKILAVLLLSALFGISCKSVPAAPPVAVKEDVVIIEIAPIDFGTLGDIIAEAQAKRAEITDNDLEVQNLDKLVPADESLLSAESVYNLGETASSANDKGVAAKDAQSALEAYNNILNQFWFVRASEARRRASSAQQEALKVKADVAVKPDYNLSAEVFNNGEATFKTKDYKESVGFFVESESLFVSATTVATEKRRLASIALQSAEKKIEESERIASDAESVLGGEQL
jgi:hypothetical protein